MSFEVPIVSVEGVVPIENADKIEAVKIGGYQSIVQKGQYKVGDLVAYIPEASVVPAPLLEEMGLTGKLHGAGKNRVKAIKLRGCLSQGLVYPASRVVERANDAHPDSFFALTDEAFPVGRDVAEILGIQKWEPPIPTQFNGQLARPRGEYNLINFDIENIKKYDRVLEPLEEVIYTEKLHGTLMQAVYWPETDQFAVASKGLGARGFIIEDRGESETNTYILASRKYGLKEAAKKFYDYLVENGQTPEAVFILGEVFGNGIQDLGYGQELQFRVFDLYVGKPNQGFYVDALHMRLICEQVIGLEAVPLLYHGPFSEESLKTYTDGLETVSGRQLHVREGVVIRPVVEREDRKLGRVILKSVSEKYLLRGGNTTEYN